MILAAYLVRKLLISCAIVFCATGFVVALGDLLELSRRANVAQIEDAPLMLMAFFHMPSVLTKGLAYVMLIGALSTFLGLARRSELVVMRAVGQSAWRVLTAPFFAAMVLGIIGFSVFNPLSSRMLAQFETLENRHFNNQTSQFAISEEGLWLRQTHDDGHLLIRAARSNTDGSRLAGVMLLEFHEDGSLMRRSHADYANLQPGYWNFETVTLWEITPQAEEGILLSQTQLAGRDIPTDLTPKRIAENFADPRALSFWQLPEFIEDLERAGFSATNHRLHMQTELAKPLFFGAMLLIGAAFSMRHARFGGTGPMIIICVTVGFLIFFLSDLAHALGASGAIPVYMAAWVPPLVAFLFGCFVLLQLEDG